MLLFIIFLAVALLVGWLFAEFKAKAPVRVVAGIVLIACVAYAAFLSGRLYAAIEWAWVQKEHSFMGASMQRVQDLLARGDTVTVSRAAAAYNQTVRESTNEFGYYRASMAMSDILKEKK